MNATAPSRTLAPGAACSFLIGGLYVFIILYAIAVPAGNRFETGGFFAAYAADPALMNFLWILMAAIGLVSIALIPFVSRFFRGENPEWIRVAENFGLAGAILSAASFLGMLGSAPGLAQSFLQGDAAVRAAVDAIGLPQLDPLRVLILGGTGVWFLILDAMAWRSGRFGRVHVAVGMTLGIFLWAAVLAAIFHLDLLDQIAAGVGGVCAPAWYLLTGIQMLKKEPPLRAGGKLIPNKG